MKRLYAVNGFGIGPFPKFHDSYKTLTQARGVARNLIKEGCHTVDILRDLKRPEGYFGIPRETVETITCSVKP